MIRRLSADELRRDGPRPLRATPTRDPSPEPADWRRAQLAQVLEAFMVEELALAPARICALVERELARFHGAGEVSIRAHPDDLALLAPAALAAQHELASPLKLEPDPTMRRGGCLLHAASGEVDASVETRLARALEALLARAP